MTEKLDVAADLKRHIVQTIEQAFAQICCRLGHAYQFEQQDEGWRPAVTDVDQPECSSDAIISAHIKPRHAKHDLISQAVNDAT